MKSLEKENGTTSRKDPVQREAQGDGDEAIPDIPAMKFTNVGHSWRVKCKRWIKRLYRVCKSTIGAVVVTILLLFTISYLLMVLEAPFEKRKMQEYKACKALTTDKLFNESLLVLSVNDNKTAWMEQVRESLEEYEGCAATLFQSGFLGDDEELNDPVWTYKGAVFYCATLMTTIGYGTIAARTTAGRVVTMCYSAVTIPLTMVILSKLGTVLQKLVAHLWHGTIQCCKRRCSRKKEDGGESSKAGKSSSTETPKDKLMISRVSLNEELIKIDTTSAKGPIISTLTMQKEPAVIEDEKNMRTPMSATEVTSPEPKLPLTVALVVLVLYMVFGMIVFAYVGDSNWDLLTSFYYCFITVTTIGLGDVVPNHVSALMLTAGFIYTGFGLSLTSMVINVVIEVVGDKYAQAANKLKRMVDNTTPVHEVQAKLKALSAFQMHSNGQHSGERQETIAWK